MLILDIVCLKYTRPFRHIEYSVLNVYWWHYIRFLLDKKTCYSVCFRGYKEPDTLSTKLFNDGIDLDLAPSILDRKLRVSLFFSKFKRHISVINHRTKTKFEFNQYITMTHSYINQSTDGSFICNMNYRTSPTIIPRENPYKCCVIFKNRIFKFHQTTYQ